MPSIVASPRKKGRIHIIFKELAVEDTPGFSEYMRMPHTKFVTRRTNCFLRKVIKCVLCVSVCNEARNLYEEVQRPQRGSA